MNVDNYPLVSVLIPFYNHNRFIKKTLDSIKEDSYPNKEVIIIDDGSSQKNDSNIVNWINKYKKEIVVKYIKRENKGLTKTLNELIKISKGKYLLPCASDDYLVNNTLLDRVELLEKIESKNKLILISDNIVVDDNDKLLFASNLFEFRHTDRKKLFSDDGLKYSVIKQWSFAGPSWIANRKIFDVYNLYFDENLIVEDWDFFLRVIANNYALYYDQKVSAYRWHESNSCKTNGARIHHDLKKTALKNSNLFEEPYREMLKDFSEKQTKVQKYVWIKKIDPFRLIVKITKRYRYKIKNYFNKN